MEPTHYEPTYYNESYSPLTTPIRAGGVGETLAVITPLILMAALMGITAKLMRDYPK